eukprot:4823_1
MVSKLTLEKVTGVWEAVAILLTVIFLCIVLYFIHQSIVNRSPHRKLKIFMLFALLFQLVSIVTIGNKATESSKHKHIYYAMEFTSSTLLLYPSILRLITICNTLYQIQTLSHIFLFKFVCFVFIIVDIVSRMYCALYLTHNYDTTKWTFGVIISWSTVFITLIVLLCMIRSQSIAGFNYIKDVLDPHRKTMLFEQILRLNVMCFSFIIYCILILTQIFIEMFGENNQTLCIIGMYNQWILANTLLIVALLYTLKDNGSFYRNYELNNQSDFHFRLLEDNE